MQYIACKFRPDDSRSYTYSYEGDGWKRVEVVSISDQAPPFACKPILGKCEPEPEGQTAVREAI